MKPAGLNHRLSGIDAAFLYLERKEIPLHIASVAIFEEPVPYDGFVANIESKLHLIPRYRQIVAEPPFHLGYPSWEYDPHFDIQRHIFPVHLAAPGGDAELEALAGSILSQVMDRAKPLWEVYVVDGLKDGRGALIARVHHALADGISGAALLKVMLDPTPEGSHALRPRRFRPPRQANANHSLSEAIAGAAYSTLENLIAAEAGVLDFTQALLSERMQRGLEGLLELLPELTSFERLPFNKPCGGDRKFCWTEVDWADAQAIRAAGVGTLNDVILTVVTHALARYVRLHGEAVDHRFLRVVCPVSVRREDNGESLGNRITFLPVSLPLDIPKPARLLEAVARRTEIMKSARAAELVAIAASWLGAAPPPLQAAFWWGAPLLPLPVPLFNLICTNVPGSPVPLYTVGKRMLASYPHVPTGYELGVNCAVQSYAGKLFFGFTADAHVAPDVGKLRDLVQSSFRQLCRAAGVRKARAREAPRGASAA